MPPSGGKPRDAPSWRGDEHGRRIGHDIGHDGLGLAAHAHGELPIVRLPATDRVSHVARQLAQKPAVFSLTSRMALWI